MENGTSTANDSDYCKECKVKIVEDNCFCDWPENLDVQREMYKAKKLSESLKKEAKRSQTVSRAMQCNVCGSITGEHGFSFDYDRKLREQKKEWFETYVIEATD